MRDLTVTLVQADLAWQDPAANRARLAALLQAQDGPTDLVILPEMFTTGFTMDAAANAEPAGGPSEQWLAELARDLGTTLCGSLIVADGGRCYNRLVWMPPAGPAGYYDKRHLFRMAGEHEHYAAGRERRIFDLHGWRVCPLICYDLRFPVWSRGANAFDLLLYVANWPAARRSAWRTLLPARAVENQCYVAGVNRVGVDGKGVRYVGDSAVYDHLGESLLDCGGAAMAASVRLDGAELVRYREKFPAWRDADSFTLLTDGAGPAAPAGNEPA